MEYNEIIDFINSELYRLHMSQAELARKIVVYPQTLNNYLSMDRIMPLGIFLQIMDAIGKPLNFTITKSVVIDKKITIGSSDDELY